MDNEKRTKGLGALTGKVLVFGGVYSNLQALEQLQKLAVEQGIAPSNIICTGDVVGYCADAEACAQSIKSWNINTIAGNVELQLREGEIDCGCDFTAGSRCDSFSRMWYPYAQQQMSKDSLEWMHNLPDFIRFDYAGKECFVLHGGTENISAFVFRSTPWEVKAKEFENTGADVILGGHCGLPFTHAYLDKLWLNAGVIGMPANNGNTEVWCMVLDDANGEFTASHHSFTYDYEHTAKSMEANHLPPEYVKTISTGIWDNCEILPEVETAAQGKPIVLEAVLVNKR